MFVGGLQVRYAKQYNSMLVHTTYAFEGKTHNLMVEVLDSVAPYGSYSGAWVVGDIHVLDYRLGESTSVTDE